MGVKIAKAMGHKVMVISSSKKKEALAKEKGADFFVTSIDLLFPDKMKALKERCDIILNTISAKHEAMTYM